jgi:acetyl-CoA carboxylase biotin carboxyl carrier protein
MNIKEVKDLIHDILQSDINEFELEHTGTRIRLRRGVLPGEIEVLPAAPAGSRPSPIGRETSVPLTGVFLSTAVPKEEATQEDGLHTVTSPIVGTFYRTPAPTAEPYVRIGAKVEVGSILCIVEAMKLMNEIPSDAAGEVVDIYVENGHPVEFGQKLFGIRTHK